MIEIAKMKAEAYDKAREIERIGAWARAQIEPLARRLAELNTMIQEAENAGQSTDTGPGEDTQDQRTTDGVPGGD